MLKQIIFASLFLVFLVNTTRSCSANCPNCELYDLWNLEIMNNNGAPCSSYSLATPSKLNKVKYTNPTVSERKYLSMYEFKIDTKCKIFCPPASYI
jgi:hypothetical protein